MVVVLLLWARPARTEEPPLGTEQVVFDIGMAKVCFRNVNRNDATAAYRLLLESQGKRLGMDCRADPRIYDDTASFEAAIQKTPMQMAVMDAWQFLTMDIHQKMKPFFTVMEHGKVGRKYLVLTRRDSEIRMLGDLRGKGIIQTEVARAQICKAWLDTLLLAEGWGPQEEFFGNLKTVGKASAAVLPVFFGQSPACVIDQSSFEVLKELNPQLGKMLRVLAISDPFADVFICLSETGWRRQSDKANTIQSLRDLHVDTVGKQVCLLFKIDRMVPFEDRQLDTVRKLRATYKALQTAAKP